MQSADNKPVLLDGRELHLHYPKKPEFPPLQITGDREPNKAIFRYVPTSADTERIKAFLEKWGDIKVVTIQYSLEPGVILVEFIEEIG